MTEKRSILATIRDPGFQAQMRIASGLGLFFYVLAHFLNHAIGLWSFEAMEVAGGYFRQFWRFLPFSIFLYGAFLAHIILVLMHLFERRTLSMSNRERLQIVLGLTIPFLMILHILATRMAHDVYGLNDSYTFVILATWVQSPASGYVNVVGLVIVWIHGCIGLNAWLHLKSWYRGAWPSIALVIATMIPLLALTGFMSAGREIEILAVDGEWLGSFYEDLNLPDFNLGALLTNRTLEFRIGFAIILIIIIVMRIARYLKNRQNSQVEINYMDGPVIRHPNGTNLLEISRIHNVPLASVCGGRGRCSTCRVRIVQSDNPQTPADDGEQKVLRRIKAEGDVRLACQLVPTGKLKIVKLLPADANLADMGSISNQSSGVEQVVAVLFSDIRGFTARSESKLPFDVVYLVNQFSRAMGAAVEQSGGQVDKFLGDGLMALFGINSTPMEACRAALIAAREMQDALDELNTRLADDLDEPLKIGIGIHAGSVVLGDMGYGASRGLTAIGDTVNTASRLEAATKEQGVSLCISTTVAELANTQFDIKTKREISVRGKRQSLLIHALKREELHKFNDAEAVNTT